MKFLMRLALLLVAAALAVSVPAVGAAAAGLPGSATTSMARATGGTRAEAVARAEAEIRLLAARPASAASTPTNIIENNAATGLGVIHTKDGSYTHGTYDAVLPENEDTYIYFGWGGTAGWYTGPGYCTVQYRSETPYPGDYVRQSPDLGSGQHFIGSTTSYIVESYHC